MQPRIESANVAPEGRRSLLGLEAYVRRCGLEPALLDLVKLRASRINGCAYCIDMHTKDARSREKPSSGCTRSPPGGRRRSLRNRNAPR